MKRALGTEDSSTQDSEQTSQQKNFDFYLDLAEKRLANFPLDVSKANSSDVEETVQRELDGRTLKTGCSVYNPTSHIGTLRRLSNSSLDSSATRWMFAGNPYYFVEGTTSSPYWKPDGFGITSNRTQFLNAVNAAIGQHTNYQPSAEIATFHAPSEKWFAQQFSINSAALRNEFMYGSNIRMKVVRDARIAQDLLNMQEDLFLASTDAKPIFLCVSAPKGADDFGRNNEAYTQASWSHEAIVDDINDRDWMECVVLVIPPKVCIPAFNVAAIDRIESAEAIYSGIIALPPFSTLKGEFEEKKFEIAENHIHLKDARVDGKYTTHYRIFRVDGFDRDALAAFALKQKHKLIPWHVKPNTESEALSSSSPSPSKKQK